MKELNMEYGIFEVSVKPTESETLLPTGLDDINFLIEILLSDFLSFVRSTL